MKGRFMSYTMLHQPSKLLTFPLCGGPFTSHSGNGVQEQYWRMPHLLQPRLCGRLQSCCLLLALWPDSGFSWSNVIQDAFWDLSPPFLHPFILRWGRVFGHASRNKSLKDARKNKSTFNVVMVDALLFESVVVNGKVCDKFWPPVQYLKIMISLTVVFYCFFLMMILVADAILLPN